MTRILGIETSCDETGVAVVDDGCRIVADEIASQIDIHAEFGGVVPEIASRQHTEIISQLVHRALKTAGDRVDAVAVTAGPGLMGSLLVGVCYGKAFARARGVPVIPVHHIEGHLFSAFLEGEPPAFPALALVVSGGHTQLIHCRVPGDYEILGTTRDDAVGESFDKVARLLELGYPGGPRVQKAAEGGDPTAFSFPKGLEHHETLDFSYSGLKTAVLYLLRQHPDANRADVAASFQEAAVDILVSRTNQALKLTGAPRLLVVGGVAANRRLRDRICAESGVPVLIPSFRLCTDNAAMIAAAGYSKFSRGLTGSPEITPNPALSLV